MRGVHNWCPRRSHPHHSDRSLTRRLYAAHQLPLPRPPLPKKPERKSAHSPAASSSCCARWRRETSKLLLILVRLYKYINLIPSTKTQRHIKSSLLYYHTSGEIFRRVLH
jgi:hypothetical protein